MPENITMNVSIPVKPHVKQYLERNIFFKKPYVLSTTSTIGSFLVELLEPKGKSKPPLRYHPDRIISVDLTSNYCYQARPYLSFANARRFNRFVERKIKEEAYVFITVLGNYSGKELNDCIREFQIHYGFQEEFLSFDRLKKAYYRYRKDEESRIRRAVQESVLNLSLK